MPTGLALVSFVPSLPVFGIERLPLDNLRAHPLCVARLRSVATIAHRHLVPAGWLAADPQPETP